MHIEKIFFENILHIIMSVEGEMKDNAKSREDLKAFCVRLELKMDQSTCKYLKACYTLDK